MFVVLFGIVMVMIGDVGKCFIVIFEDINMVIMCFVIIIMNLVLYGVYVLMVKFFFIIGGEIILSLVKYFFLVFGVLIFYGLVIYLVLLKVFLGLNFVILMKKMCDVVLFVFSILSSSVILFVIMEMVKNKFGVGNLVLLFILLLGVIINMDGMVIM